MNGSKVVLKGDTVFANNTADYGGTTCEIYFFMFFKTGRNVHPKVFWLSAKKNKWILIYQAWIYIAIKVRFFLRTLFLHNLENFYF